VLVLKGTNPALNGLSKNPHALLIILIEIRLERHRMGEAVLEHGGSILSDK